MQRLAAFAPQARLRLIRSHGVLVSNGGIFSSQSHETILHPPAALQQFCRSTQAKLQPTGVTF
jgi:hypothetical protein